MIRAQSADGTTHEFPEGTPDDVVDKAMSTYASEHQNKTSTVQQVGRGMMDPLEGAAQMLSHVVPKPIEEGINSANNWLADKTGMVARLPEGGMDERVKKREEAIQAERGGTKDTDWARLGGNVASPLNYVGPAAISGSGWAVNTGRAMLGGILGGLSQPVVDTDNFAKEKAKDVGIGAAAGGVIGGGVAPVAGAATRQLGSFLARNYPENIASDAVTAIIRRIGQDQKAGGPSATEMIDLVNAASKPTALIDVAGSNVEGLAGRVARQPGESKALAESLIIPRDEGAAKRLSEDISQYVSGGPTMHQAAEGLMQARSAVAKPLYDNTYKLEGVWSPRLEEFLADPLVKQGLTKGYELERLHSLASGTPLTATQLGVDIGIDGSIKMFEKPNMRLLDMAKKGLDAMVAEERNDLTGRLSARGVALDQMRKAYVKTIDDLDTSGAYKKARSAWAGYSQSLDALRMGRTVFAQSPEENAAVIKAMSPTELEFYRTGVADRMREQLAKAGLHGDEGKQLLKNSWMREQLRPVFRSVEDYDKFVDAVATETKMFEKGRRILGGSQTAERVAEDRASDPVLAGAKFMFKAKTNPLAAVKDAWQFYTDVGLKPSPELNAKIAQILFSPKLDAADKVVQALRDGKAPDKVNFLKAVAGGLESAGVYGGTGAGVAAETADRK